MTATLYTSTAHVRTGPIRTAYRTLLTVAAAAALAACTTPTATPPSGAAPAPAKPSLPAASLLVAQVRAAGNQSDALSVQPLRDPQVEDLRVAALRLESEGKLDQAATEIARAVAILPNDPELLQQSAEIALHRGDWTVADQFARRSYKLGPKLGGLCRRNWTTIRIVGQAQDNETVVAEAAAALPGCTAAPPVRM